MSAPWIVVTGLDGSGKTHVVERLAAETGSRMLHIPHQPFVRDCLARSGDGTQFGDTHTDRLLFALDARLTNYEIRDWRGAGISIVSQRGWTDNFVFGMLQHFGYEETAALLRPQELERPSALVHMVAEPAAAFERIRADPDRDKYETADFLIPQHAETLRLYREIEACNPALAIFHDIPSIMVDSTERSYEAVCGDIRSFLSDALPGLALAEPELPTVVEASAGPETPAGLDSAARPRAVSDLSRGSSDAPAMRDLAGRPQQGAALSAAPLRR